MEGWRRDSARLCAPLLWEYELATAVCKAVALGMFDQQQATAAMESLLGLQVERVSPDLAMHTAALFWADKLGQVVAYDAQYLALAERLGADFWTADRRLSRRAGEAGANWVHCILDGLPSENQEAGEQSA